MPRLRTHRTALSWIGLLLTPLLAGAQPKDDEGPPLFIETIDVEVVNVEAFVTDKEGRRIEDLGLDDFEILEDGRPVEITNFYSSFRESAAVRNAREGVPLLAEPESPTEDQRLNLAIYVDHLSLRPANRKRVLEALSTFVEERLAQGDRILLLGYNGALETAQPFTTDGELLQQGLEGMAKISGVRRADDAQHRLTKRLMIQASREVPPDPVAALSYLRTYAQAAESDVQRATGALRAAVRSLAGLPGRKAMVYVSDGWSMRPGEDLYQFLLDLFDDDGLRGQVINPTAEIQRYSQSHRFQEISAEANAQQVTLYSIDARGASSGTLRADQAGISAAPGGALLVESQRTEGAREGLFAMAAATGGSVAFETFDYGRVFDTLSQDFDSYYSLGYRSRAVGDQKPHKIEVKVLRPGLRVRHRQGFLNKTAAQRVADQTLAALQLGGGQNPLGAAVQLGKPVRDSRRDFTIQVLVAVPMANLTLVPEGDQMRGRLRFFVAVQDENGVSEPHSEIYPVDIPQASFNAAKTQNLGYGVRVKVRRGLPTLAVGVLDELSGTKSVILEQVRVGS